MPVITINGPSGGGSVTIGEMVSQQLGLSFVDRFVTAEAARIVGKPISALVDKEQRIVRFRDRFGQFLQNMLERSALSGVSGEPYFGRGLDSLPPETYADLASGSATTAVKVDDKAFIDATTKVLKDLHQKGDVVIIGRGANIILADTPGVMHVGLMAPLEVRIQTMMIREHMDREEAQEYVEELERARVAYFQKFFKVSPDEPTLYHLMLNMDKMQPKTAADVIAHAAGDLAH
jgi:cytidylate kinase